ncbi:unnamed protein product [Darwinula stevensoni]|uniref:Uncharacterized protein n=1 Tax=Darwinula stevensoni TaxID=69355 RepID=A0A7R9AF32_9CRUS|nr:unnamed protein product [Darwinula stevensoni]CAG0902603.1 unnamed protein product [Darwinula stevensoni]
MQQMEMAHAGSTPSKARKVKKEYEHNCEESRKLSKLFPLEMSGSYDPRESHMKVCLAGYQELPFLDGAKKYQQQYYPNAEETAYSFPAGYVLKEKEQKKLLEEMNAKPTGKDGEAPKIPSDSTAVAKVFHYVKEELTDSPSFVIYDYVFTKTFYEAMGITGRKKGHRKQASRGKRREGFDILQGDHDVCGIVLDGKRVLVVFFQVKGREIMGSKYSLKKLVGYGEYQLKKDMRVFQQVFGANTYSNVLLCGFVALPHMSRSEVKESLGCHHDSILTKDDLDLRDSFRDFLKRNGFTLGKQKGVNVKARDRYLEVIRTYMAASVSVEGMPRTVEDLRKNVDEGMKKVLILLTPQQKMILKEDRKVLFIVGGQGTGKTYLLLNRAQELVDRGEKVVIVNMSEGELTHFFRKWKESESPERQKNIEVITPAERSGDGGKEVDYILKIMNAQKEKHFLIDEMLVNHGMKERDPEEVGQLWKSFAEKVECRTIWIVWRPSDSNYPEAFDMQKVVDSVGHEKVELLTAIMRCTREMGEFLVGVTQFLQKRFRCHKYLPMLGLKHQLQRHTDPHEARVLFVKKSSDDTSVWASAALAISQEFDRTDVGSLPLVIITRTKKEKEGLKREISRTKNVAFLDPRGTFCGSLRPEFLIFWELEVTGMSFEHVILLDDSKSTYRSWFHAVCMARRTLHVITTDPFPFGHWEEPEQKGLVSWRPLSPLPTKLSGLPDLPSYEQLQLSPFIGSDSALSRYAVTEEKVELIFGGEHSGKTEFLKKRFNSETEETRESEARKIYIDCSRWSKEKFPRSLSLVYFKEKMERDVEVFDVHDLQADLKLYNDSILSCKFIEVLLAGILKNGTMGHHIALDYVPINRIGTHGDTEGLTRDWKSTLQHLCSRFQASLASITIFFHPYVEYRTTTFDIEDFKKGFRDFPEVKILDMGYQNEAFSDLLQYILKHESPYELQVKPGTLPTRPQPSSLVFGEKPTLITPPNHEHYHGGWKCLGGRGCVAVTAAEYLLSHALKDNIVVLISDQEVKEVFIEFLDRMKAPIPQIHHPEKYRGCESHEVMCVGVEDSWMVEGISRAIRTLFIVDGGNHPTIPTGPVIEEDAEKGAFLRKENRRVFALGANERKTKYGIWEVFPWEVPHLPPTQWFQTNESVVDLFLAHSGRLIYGREKEVRIFHLGKKNPCEAPWKNWGEKFPVHDPFSIQFTAGAISYDSLFLMGGERNPQKVLQLDLYTGIWMPLSPLEVGRKSAVAVMRNPHTIMVLGGEDPEKRLLSSCEFLDTRENSSKWVPFTHDIPTPVDNHAVTLCNDRVYISGGWNGRESMKNVFKMDVNGGWEELPPLILKRQYHGMINDGERLTVIGGRKAKETNGGSGAREEVLMTETLTLDGGKEAGQHCGECRHGRKRGKGQGKRAAWAWRRAGRFGEGRGAARCIDRAGTGFGAP